MNTRTIKASEVSSSWVVFDATDQILGRLAVQAARLLMGKHKPSYSPNIDNGDHVVIVNAEKVRVTGKKLEQKLYRQHSGYPGGLREETLASLLKRHPERVIEHAVRGMIPRTKLGDAMIGKLRVYAGPAHPHQGQVNPGPVATAHHDRRSKEIVALVSSDEAEPQAT
jgi:large subunit ribosomal protein L13